MDKITLIKQIKDKAGHILLEITKQILLNNSFRLKTR